MTTIRSSSIFPEIRCIERQTFGDERGFFREYFRLNDLEASVGKPLRFIQANHSHSAQRALRGVHVAAYDKLIYVAAGTVTAVFVDMRAESATFGQFERITLGDEARLTVFLPAGFGNAYYVESPFAEYLYLVTEYFDPAKEFAIRWDDPDLGLPWRDASPLLSERDKAAVTVRQRFPERFSHH